MAQLLKHLHGVEASPVTTGKTIHWAFAYDFVVNLLTLNHAGALRAESIKLAAIEPGASVLDVGCGTGDLALLAKAAAGAYGNVVGIDAAPEMIDAARRKAQKAGVQVNFQTGVVEALDFPDGTFDRVLSSLMVHHLPDDLKGRALVEVRRVLKPGGQLLIVDFDPSGGRSGIAAMVHGRTQADPSELKQMVERAGFSGIEGGALHAVGLVFVRATRG